MTEGKDFKRLIRERMARTGESYTTARAYFQLKQQRTATGPSVGGVDAFRELVYTRSGIEDLPKHLERHYGIEVKRVTELDLGVFRIDRGEGPSWVARVFSKSRPLEAVLGDAEILRFLEGHGFPAERCAHPDAVSIFEGQGVLVTEFVPGPTLRAEQSPEMLHLLGDLLGQLHSLPPGIGAVGREAGSWHSLSVAGGDRGKDVETLLPLLAEAGHSVPDSERGRFDLLCDEVSRIEGNTDLPRAMTHPDYVGANVVASNRGPVLIDWTGAGWGPRISSLAGLLSDAGGVTWQDYATVDPPRQKLRLVDAVIAGYRKHIELDHSEISRLGNALQVFPLILDAWSFVFHQGPLHVIARRIPVRRQMAEKVVLRVRMDYELDMSELARWNEKDQPTIEGQETLF